MTSSPPGKDFDWKNLAIRIASATVLVPTGATHRLDRYEILPVRGFPQFQKRRDLEVCFDTVPAGPGTES